MVSGFPDMYSAALAPGRRARAAARKGRPASPSVRGQPEQRRRHFLIAFIAYQVYRMKFAPSVGLAGLAVCDAVVAHAREAVPDECCGILIGTHDEVVAAVRAANLSESSSRFLIDPQDHIRARREARAALARELKRAGDS